MDKVRGKWFVIENKLGIGWEVVATDFDTEEKALEYCKEFGGRASYHPTVDECMYGREHGEIELQIRNSIKDVWLIIQGIIPPDTLHENISKELEYYRPLWREMYESDSQKGS